MMHSLRIRKHCIIKIQEKKTSHPSNLQMQSTKDRDHQLSTVISKQTLKVNNQLTSARSFLYFLAFQETKDCQLHPLCERKLPGNVGERRGSGLDNQFWTIFLVLLCFYLLWTIFLVSLPASFGLFVVHHSHLSQAHLKLNQV